MHPTGSGRAKPAARSIPQAIVGALALIAGGMATASHPIERDRPAAASRGVTVPIAAGVMPPRLPGAPSRAEAVEPSQAERARAINAALPFAGAAAIAARPFVLAASVPDEERALLCLAQAIYYEAGYEPLEGRRAVAQVVLNRLRHPAFPKSVCGVVYDGSTAPGCQFSFTCDGSLRRPAAPAAWRAAMAVAGDALRGHVVVAVGQATHYHTDWVAPYWAPSLTKIRQIGAHIFYRFPGRWGTAAAFASRYSGHESVPALASGAIEDPARMAAINAPPERRAPNDVGGRLDISRGWTLAIPTPSESGGSLARITSSQAVVEQPVTASASRSGGDGG